MQRLGAHILAAVLVAWVCAQQVGEARAQPGLERSSSCPEMTAPVPSLCDPPRNNDCDIEEYVFARLQVRQVGPEQLCWLDAVVVQAASQCDPPKQCRQAWWIATLMRLLALRWRSAGDLPRAKVVAEHAYAVAMSAPFHSDAIRIDILQVWAQVELELGNGREARELARRQTEIAWSGYEEAQTSITVEACLRFEAAILEAIGLTQESAEVLRMADALAALPRRCDGVCQGPSGKIE
jgi:hypothetical protein